MKKLLIIGVFVFAFALAITPAFAFQFGHNSGTSNFAVTNSSVGSYADTGGNSINKNLLGGTKTINTGTANAQTLGINAINTNVNIGGSRVRSTNNTAFTTSIVSSEAYSGANKIKGNAGGAGTISTGIANAETLGINLVNTNVKVGH
jgi:hypothetical protein